MLLRSSKSGILKDKPPAMPFFPKTETAFQLATEYCTLQRIKFYSSCFIKKDEETTSIMFWTAFRSLDLMYAEMNEIADKKYQFKTFRKDYSNLLSSYLQDERISHFNVSAARIVDKYNSTCLGNKIDSANTLTPFHKDGYYIVGHFKEMVQNYLSEYPLEIAQTKAKNEIQEDIINQRKFERLATDLTAKQLLYLFKSLQREGLIKQANKTSIATAIAMVFKYGNSSSNKQQNIKHLQNEWSQLDTQTAQDWFEKFAEMSNKAKLDNPNRIKK